MIIFPAVDLQNGKAVRLRQGLRDKSTIFGHAPVAIAAHWQTEGADWLHVVDLDGAFDGQSENGGIIANIAALPGLKVQVGGGIRGLDACEKYLSSGVERLIIGTIALENPNLFRQMCREFPGKIGVSLDADHGRLKTRGWVDDSGKTVREILPSLEDAGAAFVIYTDIERDGMKSGLNLAALGELLENTPLPVIAAGGVHKIEDVQNIFQIRDRGNLEGMITGRAIYENTLNLKEALVWLRKQN